MESLRTFLRFRYTPQLAIETVTDTIAVDYVFPSGVQVITMLLGPIRSPKSSRLFVAV